MTTLGFIGFGEAPRYIAGGLSKERARLLAYDVQAGDDTPRARTLRRRAEETGVTLVKSLEELLSAADVVLNFTSADAAAPIAHLAAPLLKERKTYLDMNSTSPGTKQALADIFSDSAGDFVEAAVMSSVPAGGARVPISLCGKTGAEVSARLNALGMNTTFLGEEIGQASATKILRSVLAKGMIALLTETVFAAEHYGLTEEILEKFLRTMVWEMSFREFCQYSVCSAAIHNGRFCHEMEEAVKMLEDLGEDAFMTRAALEKFTRLRDQGFGERFTERPKPFDEVLRVKYLLENGDVNDV